MLRRSCGFVALLSTAVIGVWPVCAESSLEVRRQRVIQQVDQILLAKMGAVGIEPSSVASDAEFMRRVYLDLSGQVPRVSAIRDFLSSAEPTKRELLVDRLLTKPKTFDHLAEVWRSALLPTQASPELLQQASGLQAWLRERFSKNLRYDRIVSDLVATTGSASDGPALFFTALDTAPSKIAAATARMFLGLQLACAECHDHPFDDWKQEEFWGYAAFFARLPRTDGMTPTAGLRLTDRLSGEVTLPGTERVVLPKFPGGRQVGTDEPGTRRQQLSIWMSSHENPYLARAAVNRVWAMLFGRGIVDPVDDFGPHHPASHPELLELLTEYFLETDYDLRNLLRTLCATQAYQRTSQRLDDGFPPPEFFATMAVKVLTPEQLYDSLYCCLAQTLAGDDVPTGGLEGPDNRRLQFVAQMGGRAERATEFGRGLQQTLRMMNGVETAGATSVTTSPLLRSLEAPFLTDDQRIEILYLATLARDATPVERERLQVFIHESDPNAKAPWEDALWALINSAEFALNH